MDDVRVVLVDPLADDELLAGWVDTREAVERAEFGDRHAAYSVQEIRERQRTTTNRLLLHHAALVGEEMVGWSRVDMPQADNLHLAVGELGVLPQWRCRGVGTALLRQVQDAARRAGRRTLCVESEEAAGSGSADVVRVFATGRGFAAAQANLRSELDLPGPRTPDVAASPEYDLVTTWDGVPERWLEQRAVLGARMSTDAPMGDVELEPEVWDVERVLQFFATPKAQGRRVVETLAVHRDSGVAVGLTTMAVSLQRPDVAYQWDTLVLREHRGHGLGLRLKVANLAALSAQMPAVQRVVTWNDDTNAPMLAVNEAIGFRPIGVLTEWQQTL